MEANHKTQNWASSHDGQVLCKKYYLPISYCLFSTCI